MEHNPPGNELERRMGQAHSAGLFNVLVKTQHELLLGELTKLEALDRLIVQARERRTVDHEQKMGYYRQTQELLQKEIRRKDEVMRRLAVIGLPERSIQEGNKGRVGSDSGEEL
jgi:hypothetical protein